MRRLLLTAVLLAAPRAAFACPVCFGQSDSPLAKATNLGIMVMLVVVGGVLACFASFMIYLNRRARLASLEPTATPRAQFASVDPQEGTAQC